jgi:zinc protease
MNRSRILAAGLCLALAASGAASQQAPAQQKTSGMKAEEHPIQLVTLPSPGSPIVAVRLLFDVGSIHDPAGKEGLAALTGFMVAQAGTQKRSYKDLLETLYPMAASINVTIDREITEIGGQVHRDKLAEYTALLQEAVLQPAFSEADFQRNKEQLVAYLTNSLRSNDELLGLEMLQQEIFENHPYGHAPAGTVEGLGSLTLDDVKKFYKEHYTQSNLMLGVGGGYPTDYPGKLQKDLAALPKGEAGRLELPALPKIEGRNYTIVDKQTGSVGLHFGWPIPITRADADFYPLMVATSYLGEHRTSHGRLYQELREKRGLNYGDYAYLEYYANPPFTSNPTPNVPRRQQYYSIWIRPVVPEDAQFALRGALAEVHRLREEGLTKEEFELTRDYLRNYTKLWAQSLSDRLGFLMESTYYGTPYFIEEIEKNLAKITVADVNRVVKKYITPDNYDAVLVTANGAAVKEMLQKDEPSPKTYNAAVAEEVTERDKQFIGLKVKPTALEVVPVDQTFQK